MLAFVLTTCAFGGFFAAVFWAYCVVLRDINERRRRSLPHGGQ